VKRVGAQPPDRFQHRARVEAARAGIDAHRQLALAARHHLLQHAQRRIVHRLVAAILQRAQHRRLAAAGQAGDDHNGQGGRAAHAAKAPAT
jgi:hypothetical protein